MAKVEMCLDGSGQFRTVALGEVTDVLEEEQSFVWIDVDADQPLELKGLAERFGLHGVDVEAALSLEQRPKISLYDDMIFLEFYGLRLDNDEIRADEIGIFVGERFLITVRRGDVPSLQPIQQRWQDQRRVKEASANGNPRRLGLTGSAEPRRPTPPMLLYAILDELVDGYFPVVDWLGERIELLEESVVTAKGRQSPLAIQELRTELLRLRRQLSPQQEVVNSLLRRDIPVIDVAIIPYFADVHDHLLRIHDWMESYRDHLSTIVDMQMSIQSNQLNITVRTMTASSIILMVCSLVAGIYGMNFVFMPELEWRYGYPIALLIMLSLGVGLYSTFRRRGWW